MNSVGVLYQKLQQRCQNLNSNPRTCLNIEHVSYFLILFDKRAGLSDRKKSCPVTRLQRPDFSSHHPAGCGGSCHVTVPAKLRTFKSSHKLCYGRPITHIQKKTSIRIQRQYRKRTAHVSLQNCRPNDTELHTFRKHCLRQRKYK